MLIRQGGVSIFVEGPHRCITHHVCVIYVHFKMETLFKQHMSRYDEPYQGKRIHCAVGTVLTIPRIYTILLSNHIFHHKIFGVPIIRNMYTSRDSYNGCLNFFSQEDRIHRGHIIPRVKHIYNPNPNSIDRMREVEPRIQDHKYYLQHLKEQDALRLLRL